jgi:hypothetical protein
MNAGESEITSMMYLMPYTLDNSYSIKSSSIFKQQDTVGGGEDCGFLFGDTYNMSHVLLEKLKRTDGATIHKNPFLPNWVRY